MIKLNDETYDFIEDEVNRLKAERTKHLGLAQDHPMDSSHSYRAIAIEIKVETLEWVLNLGLVPGAAILAEKANV